MCYSKNVVTPHVLCRVLEKPLLLRSWLRCGNASWSMVSSNFNNIFKIHSSSCMYIHRLPVNLCKCMCTCTCACHMLCLVFLRVIELDHLSCHKIVAQWCSTQPRMLMVVSLNATQGSDFFGKITALEFGLCYSLTLQFVQVPLQLSRPCVMALT